MSRSLFEIQGREPFELTGNSVRIGRAPEMELALASPTISRLQAECIRGEDGAWRLIPHSQHVTTTVNGVPLQGEHLLRSGDSVQCGAYVLRFVDGQTAPPVPRTGPAGMSAPSFPTMLDARGIGDLTSADRRRIWVRDTGIIGRGPEAFYRLDHPMVSASHAEVIVQGRRIALRDLSSTNGTFVDGVRLSKECLLTGSERIEIGPFSLEFTGDAFLVSTRRGNVRVVARDLVRTINGRRTLDGVSLVVEPGELVALIGPTASGKSTLLRALSVRHPADSGTVLLNGLDLEANFEALKRGVVVVSQREVLHETLPLGEALDYTARLRLPPDTPMEERAQAVARALAEVELTGHERTRISELSGGQRKRAALANETLSAPHLCFADEVTSGLDEETDREIMRLLRHQADGGMTVVIVTHTLANLEEFCHKVAILGIGGRLVFFGAPREALEYFAVRNIAQIYDILRKSDAADLKARYEASDYYARHIGRALALPTNQAPVTLPSRAPGASWRRGVVACGDQVGVLTSRVLRLFGADRQALGIALGQSLLVAVALALVFTGLASEPDAVRMEMERSLLFLIGVSCLWFGCNSASKELVKERAIYTCERDVNLSIAAYLGAKFAGLALLGAGQVLILYGVVAVTIGLPGPAGVQLMTMMLAVLAGTSLGLLVSALARTPDQATTAVPVLLIPQIVMGGRIVEDLPLVADLIARVGVTGYWVFRALDEALTAGGRSESVVSAVCVLVLHSVGVLAAAFGALVLLDARSRSIAIGVASDRCRALLSSARSLRGGLRRLGGATR